MIGWIDIAAVILSCVLVNHMGLISSIEDIFDIKLYIIDCVKCLTFWSVLALIIVFNIFDDLFISVAISFLSSYIAIWLEIAFGLIDKRYEEIYKKYFKEKTNTYNNNPKDSKDTLS